MDNRVIIDEKEYLEKTLKTIKELIEEENGSLEEVTNSIYELKKYIWENIGSGDEVEIENDMYEANKKVDHANDKVLKLQKLKKASKTPYFGRVDFTADFRKNKHRKVYIGITGISKDYNFYVFDWRSPIASLFYNYGKGKAEYEAPRGTIEGEISLKRQYKIVNGEIQRIIESDINIDDDFLQEILSKSSSEKMTNIVNTIQKEQNKIIRNVDDKYLIVQGVAGSGKTAVALHRIAYLLFQQKDLTSNNILILSPNDVFSEYISRVLPELGEENVLETTFSDFAKRYIKNKNIESFPKFIERCYKIKDENEIKIIKYKLSDEFIELLDQKIKEYKDNIYFSDNLIVGSYEFSAEELEKLFKEKFHRLPVEERIEAMIEYICDITGKAYKKNRAIIKKGLNTLIKNKLNAKDLYNKIIDSKEFKEKTNNFDNKLTNKILRYEDLIPLMYIFFEINGYPNNNHIKQVVIDEAQDYTLLQYKILKQIFKTASFTILGDINQSINPYYVYQDLNKVNSVFDNKGREIQLNKTYRSSKEIIDYTNEILDLSNACAVRRANNEPVECKEIKQSEVKKNLKFDIKEMRKNNIKRIAIITKDDEQSAWLYELLKEEIKGITVVKDSTDNKMGNVVILPSYISKGLEFDGVIVYTDAENYYDKNEQRLYYVVCTRAQHKLIVYNQKEIDIKNNCDIIKEK